MSEVTQRVRDFLTKSPSVVYPDDVLELFEQVEHENAKLRELVQDMWDWLAPTAISGGVPIKGLHSRIQKLGIEEDAYDK